jgi:hypothetical protein
LGESKITLAAGDNGKVYMTEGPKTLMVEKPGKKHYAQDYIVISPEKAYLAVRLVNGQV